MLTEIYRNPKLKKALKAFILKDPEHLRRLAAHYVEFSEDKNTIEIWFKADDTGNYYVDVPIEFIKNIIREEDIY